MIEQYILLCGMYTVDGERFAWLNVPGLNPIKVFTHILLCCLGQKCLLFSIINNRCLYSQKNFWKPWNFSSANLSMFTVSECACIYVYVRVFVYACVRACVCTSALQSMVTRYIYIYTRRTINVWLVTSGLEVKELARPYSPHMKLFWLPLLDCVTT